jgi:diamine N-acetyltransferase
MIYGDRVRLRRVEREDLPRYVEWLNDPEVRDNLAMYHPISMAFEEGWFERTLTLEPECQPFSIDARPSGERADVNPPWDHVGGCGFHSVDWRNRSGELGIVIGNRRYWSQGYGTDAVRALVSWGFDELNLNRIHLRVFEDNARAIRCYEKTGFVEEGRLRQDRFHKGRYFDTVVMAVLRDSPRLP